MTTEEILQSIEGNLSNAYSSLEKRKKVTIPAKKNFENLATTIDSIEPLLEEITIEPKTTNQLFTPSGENEGIGRVNVKAVTSAIDPNIISTNIRKGKTILGVTGNLEADKPDQEKTINPTTAQQSVVADTGYELAKVTINAVTKSIDANIKAENIKQGVSILGVQGSFQGSKAPALQEKIVDPSIIAQEITADSGYDGISKITVNAVTSKIDSNIQADNIKEGVEILGVLGTHQGGSVKFAELINGTISSVESGDLNGVEVIRNNMFANLSITKVEIPSNVTTIGDSAFANNKISSLTLNEGVTTIGDSAFANNKITLLEIPKSVTTIGDSAFAGTQITELNMDNNSNPPSVTSTTFPSSLTTIYVAYRDYDTYTSSWSVYADKIVRLPAIPSTITITVNNYLGELVSGASVTISGNGQTYTGTTDDMGVFTQGDLQPATYTITVADIDGFKTPNASEVVVLENTQNSVAMTYAEKPAVSSVFAENTLEQIRTASAEISAKNMTSQQVEAAYGWKIGDIYNVPTKSGSTFQVFIMGYNHDVLSSDHVTKAGITLGMVGFATNEPQTWSNYSNTTNGGWDNCTLRKAYLDYAFWSSMTDEWKSAIPYVDKQTSNGGAEYYSGIITSSDQRFCLSAIEVGADLTDVAGGELEGKTYEYYVNAEPSKRIKYFNGQSKDWWLRSCSSTQNRPMYVMGYNGNISAGVPYASYPTQLASAAFCI